MAPARWSNVDLPQPLRPTTATNSPARIWSDTSLSARTGSPSLWYSFTTRSTESSAGPWSPGSADEAAADSEPVLSMQLSIRCDPGAIVSAARSSKAVAGLTLHRRLHGLFDRVE